jgi:hypothetical protein
MTDLWLRNGLVSAEGCRQVPSQSKSVSWNHGFDFKRFRGTVRVLRDQCFSAPSSLVLVAKKIAVKKMIAIRGTIKNGEEKFMGRLLAVRVANRSAIDKVHLDLARNEPYLTRARLFR